MYELKYHYFDEMFLLNIYDDNTVLIVIFRYGVYQFEFVMTNFDNVSINKIPLENLELIDIEEIIKSDRKSFLDRICENNNIGMNYNTQAIYNTISSIYNFDSRLIKDDFLNIIIETCKNETKTNKFLPESIIMFNKIINTFAGQHSSLQNSIDKIIVDILNRYIFQYNKIFVTEINYSDKIIKIFLMDVYGKAKLFYYNYDKTSLYNLKEYFSDSFYIQDKNMNYFKEKYHLNFTSISYLLHVYCLTDNGIYYMDFERLAAQYCLFKHLGDATVETENLINVIFSPIFERYVENKNAKSFDMIKIEFSVIRNGKTNEELIDLYKKHRKTILKKLLKKISENKKFIKYGISTEYLKLDKIILTSDDMFHHIFILKTEKLEEV